jgi:hypothetical protein
MHIFFLKKAFSSCPCLVGWVLLYLLFFLSLSLSRERGRGRALETHVREGGRGLRALLAASRACLSVSCLSTTERSYESHEYCYVRPTSCYQREASGGGAVSLSLERERARGAIDDNVRNSESSNLYYDIKIIS